jgi:hypothetical protein
MKFSGRLIRNFPRLIESTADSGERGWRGFDGRMYGKLWSFGHQQPHLHSGPLTHLHGVMLQRRGHYEIVLLDNDKGYGPDPAVLSLGPATEFGHGNKPQRFAALPHPRSKNIGD